MGAQLGPRVVDRGIMESHAHFPDDPTFPTILRDVLRDRDDAPRPLRTRGPWPAPEGVAIVGSRDASVEALAFTRSVAEAIVNEGWAVWSGGALGIDGAAHEGAIEAGGATILVSPSGLDAPYPPEHVELFARVLERGGTLVSPFADDARPMLPAFHLRNHVLAALTFATVIVEASEKSGARSTAKHARSLGRPLFVAPHSPWDPRGRGCVIEIIEGATPILDEAHLVKELRRARTANMTERPRGGSRGSTRARGDHARGAAHERAVTRRLAHERAEALAREHAHARTLQGLDEVTTRVLASISEVPIHMDDLCERAELPVSTVTAALLTLTLGAVVVEAPAGYYRRPPTI